MGCDCLQRFSWGISSFMLRFILSTIIKVLIIALNVLQREEANTSENTITQAHH